MSDLFTPNSARTVAEAAANYDRSPEAVQAKTLNQIEKNTKSLSEVKRIADAAEQRAKVAEAEATAAKEIAEASRQLADIAQKEAESAKKDAVFSKWIAIATVVISVVALCKEPLFQLICTIAKAIFDFLNM